MVLQGRAVFWDGPYSRGVKKEVRGQSRGIGIGRGVWLHHFRPLSLLHLHCVWRRIPFAAAANLNTGMMAVKANGRIFIMAYVSVALLWGEYLRISRNGWKL